jgi:ankyrin repeat protein
MKASMYAFTDDEYEMVKFLINHKLDINHVDVYGSTVLDHAVMNSSIKRLLFHLKNKKIKGSEYKYFYNKLKKNIKIRIIIVL